MISSHFSLNSGSPLHQIWSVVVQDATKGCICLRCFIKIAHKKDEASLACLTKADMGGKS